MKEPSENVKIGTFLTIKGRTKTNNKVEEHFTFQFICWFPVRYWYFISQFTILKSYFIQTNKWEQHPSCLVKKLYVYVTSMSAIKLFWELYISWQLSFKCPHVT